MQEYAKNNRNEKIKLWKSGNHNGRRGKTATASWIRDYMLKRANFKCIQCSWSKINPYTKKIPLELSHINGDYLDNREENLEILCPNCHSLTDSYKGANKNKGRPRSKYYRGL